MAALPTLPLRRAALLLGLALAALPVAAQDAGRDGADDDPTAGAEGARPDAGPPLGDDGLPLPSFWTFDGDGPARLWLDKPPVDPADLRRRLPAWEETLASHGLVLDLEARTLALRGATIMDARMAADPIEYLVVTELGKTHEALVLVKAQPSVLQAALLALGLEPGAHTTFELKEPPPPEEDVHHGRASPWLVHPAHGPLLAIDVHWVDGDGRPRQASLESLLIDLRTGEPLAERDWIFTGSRYGTYRQGRQEKRWFKSDVEGDIVAIYLAGRDSCLFERNSLDGIEDAWWFPNPDVMPPAGTPVTLMVRPTGEAVAPREAMEGERVDWSALEEEPLPEVPAAPPVDGADQEPPSGDGA